MKTLLKEVDFIDGNKEFYLNEYKTELISKNVTEYELSEIPDIASIVFSGDTSLFKLRVLNEQDLGINGSWLLTNKTIKILNPTSQFTFTYITYRVKSPEKIQGLFSVDYERGILYTSTSLKNPTISYKHSKQYIEGVSANQMLSSNYSIDNIPTPINNNKNYVVYQVLDQTIDNKSYEFIENISLNISTKENK